MNENQLEIPQKEYDRQARRVSLLTSAAFHLLALLLFVFWTCALPTHPEEDLTEIQWGGGGGGSPSVNAPEGVAQKGSAQRSTPEASTEQPPMPTVKSATSNSSSPEKIPTEQRNEKHATSSSSRASEQTPSSEASTPSQSQGDSPTAEGDRPAGGSGGPSVGAGTGVGIGVGGVSGFGNRGWVRRPTAGHYSGIATGTVILRFDVLPDGEVVNIVPVRNTAGPDALGHARARLGAARAQALPEDAPQETVRGLTIPFNFRAE